MGLNFISNRLMSISLKKFANNDCACDLAIYTDTIASATVLQHHIQNVANDVGLHVNVRKTRFQPGKHNTNSLRLIYKISRISYIARIEINSSEKDVKMCIAKAWAAFNKMHIICKSDLRVNLQRRNFRVTTYAVLMYGATVWIVIKTLVSKLDGT